MGEELRISLAQLREPENAIRIDMNDAKLESLTESIKELGVLEPLIVTPVEDNAFEVVAGHRRLLAARVAGCADVPCKVVSDRDVIDAIRLHENVEREDLNAAEEAMFFQELYEKLGEDVDQVARAVRKPRGYVESRMLLLRGDKPVFDALQEGKIAFGVAQEINLMEREIDRKMHLDHALRGGCTIKLMRQWRKEANARAEMMERAAAAAERGGESAEASEASASLQPSYAGMAKPHELSSSEEERVCLFCQDKRKEFDMYRKYVCRPCADRHLVPAELDALKR